MTGSQVDIKENEIFALSPELLTTLLKDHTLSSEDKQVNIFWATNSYADRGDGYQYGDQITIEAITGPNGNVIVPRAVKSLLYIAYIISWNILQMDGLKGIIPNSCGERRTLVANLFGETETITTRCHGCKDGDILAHNGTYAVIKDWGATYTYYLGRLMKEYTDDDIAFNFREFFRVNDTWVNVQMQDFTEGSDIDWSKSVEEIDAQLYAKYNLSDEEISFIKSMIKPM